MKTLFKFLTLLIVLHMADCTIECYYTRLSEEKEEKTIKPRTAKGCIYYSELNNGLWKNK